MQSQLPADKLPWYRMATTMKKCIVLDLDNTLWGGVVGEDGMENLQLSFSSPGNSFLAFQQALLDAWNRGIILAINSRNNPDDAWNVIRNHPNMVLKEQHFAASRINWNDKASNIKELAKELNIGLDSMVFIDDDPTNRGMVRSLVPEVEVPEWPEDPAHYTSFFNSLPYFESTVITDEDKMRGNMYVTERLRMEEEKQYKNRDEYLASLSLKLTVYRDDPSCIPRLAQMTEKTNQFNVHKQPFSEDDMNGFIESNASAVYHARLEDRFGDYGVIILAVVDKKGAVWHIKSMLMSCRAFGRNVEDAFFAIIAEDAKKEGAEAITIDFVESPKNAPAKEFVDRLFKDFAYSIPEAIIKPQYIHTHYAAI